MATDGPERSGSAEGFPVPRSTTWVRDLGEAAGVGVWARPIADNNDERNIVTKAILNADTLFGNVMTNSMKRK